MNLYLPGFHYNIKNLNNTSRKWLFPEKYSCIKIKSFNRICAILAGYYNLFLKITKIWVTYKEMTIIINNKHSWDNNFRRKKIAYSYLLKLTLINYLRKRNIFLETDKYSPFQWLWKYYLGLLVPCSTTVYNITFPTLLSAINNFYSLKHTAMHCVSTKSSAN